jgi:hypothetical protein
MIQHVLPGLILYFDFRGMFDLNLRQKRKLKFSGFIFTLPSLENHAIILQMEKLKHETDQSKKV